MNKSQIVQLLSKRSIIIVSVILLLLVIGVIFQVVRLNSSAETYRAALDNYTSKLSSEKNEATVAKLAGDAPRLESRMFSFLSSDYQKAQKQAAATDAVTKYLNDLTQARERPYTEKTQLYRANLQFLSQLTSAFSSGTKDDLTFIREKNAQAAAKSRISLFNAYITAAKEYKKKTSDILGDQQTPYEKNYVNSIQNYISVHENEVKSLEQDNNKIFTNNRQQKMNVGLATSELQKDYSYINQDLGQSEKQSLSVVVASNAKKIVDQSQSQRSKEQSGAVAAIKVRAVAARELLPSSSNVDRYNETVYVLRSISDDIDRITNELGNKSDREKLSPSTKEIRDSISLYSTNSQIYDGAYFAQLQQAAEFDQEFYNSTGAPKLTDIFGADKTTQREIIEAQIKTQKKVNERTDELPIPSYIATEMKTLKNAQKELLRSYETILSDIEAGRSPSGSSLSRNAIAADEALDPIAEKLDDIQALSRHTTAALDSFINN